MNFEQIVESLGLDKLGSSQSRRDPPADGTRPAADEGGPEADSAVDADDLDAEDEAGDWEDAPPADEPVEDDERLAAPAVEEIRHDIDQLSAEVDTNASALRGIESQQDEFLERLERIEEHNARLLGVYDRLTAGINPFDEDWDVKYDQSRGRDVEDDDSRYGVIEPPDDVEVTESRGDAGGDTVSFEDLKRKHDESADRDGDGADDRGEGGASPDPAERQEPQLDQEPRPEPAPAHSDAYLDALAPTYATDVLVMEWLTMLVDIAGAPGALKALEYYESIDWISEPVKRQVEDVLSGAESPGETPARPPGDLTTEEHNRSFAYIMKLAQQRQPTPTRTD